MKELIDSVNFLLGQKGINYAARALEYWAYWSAYQKMIEYVKEAKDNPGLSIEVLFAPELLDDFVEHLEIYLNRHINIDLGRLVDEDLLGEKTSYEDWQEAGYPLVRTTNNYLKRYTYWRHFIMSDPSMYREVIDSRNKNYSGRGVPYWYLWENGTYGMQQPGFPTYKGIHFLERATRDLFSLKQRALMYLDRYATYYLEGRKGKPAPFNNVAWLKSAREAGVI
jgi:hypothetical protein